MAVFEDAMDEILGEALVVAEQRGGEYADTWALYNVKPVFLMNLLREFGWTASTQQLREILAVSLIDVKDSRMLGAYKEDTVIDGVNYRAFYAYLRRHRVTPSRKVTGPKSRKK